MKTIWSRTSTNGSYKLVALAVALVLWVTMQGRRDTVLSRDLEVQVLLSPGFAIANPIPSSVKLEIAGPRIALKKFAERKEPFLVDLGLARKGRQLVKLSRENLNLPLGAKVLSIQPQEFLAVIVEVDGQEKGKSDVKD